MRLGTIPKNIDTHDLVKTGDPEAGLDANGDWPPFCDRNGVVVLAYCRRCRGGESELFDQSCELEPEEVSGIVWEMVLGAGLPVVKVP